MAKKLLHYDGSRTCLPQKCLLVITHHFTCLEAYAFFTDQPDERLSLIGDNTGQPTKRLSLKKDYHAGWSISMSPELLVDVLPRRQIKLTVRDWVERVRGKQPTTTITTKENLEEPKNRCQNLEQKMIDAFVLVMEEYGYIAALIKAGNGYNCFKLELIETTKKPAD